MGDISDETIRPVAYDLWQQRGGGDGHAVADWLTARRVMILQRSYELAVSYELATGRKQYLGVRDPRKCRFCGRDALQTTFRKEAHAIPEFLGNQSLISYYECDGCNDLFSKVVEDHLSKFTLGTRVALQLRGKDGSPKFRSDSKRSRMEVKGERFEFGFHVEDGIVSIDEERHEIQCKLRTQPFIPLAAFKCFVKCGLSVLPESEISNFRDTIAWIRELDHAIRPPPQKPAACLIALTPGPPPDTPGRVMLFRRRDHAAAMPYMMLVIETSNLTFQIAVHSHEQDKHLDGKEMMMPRYPVGIWQGYRYGEPVLRLRDFSSAAVERCRSCLTRSPNRASCRRRSYSSPLMQSFKMTTT